ncbi:MAG: hypothetical protein D6767_05535 [Candidatus Hydrogenedentota bacterium]|nr:MAG: hypothetical protein D6767_05535 [Candidatus Hydrogenedentota bacterium]
MPLFEVSTKVLKQEGKDVLMRYFLDGHEQVHLHIWENPKTSKILKFRISCKSDMFEWEESKGLRYAKIDEDQTVLKIKKATMVYMQDKVNLQALKQFYSYLEREAGGNPNLEFILKKFKEVETQNEN